MIGISVYAGYDKPPRVEPLETESDWREFFSWALTPTIDDEKVFAAFQAFLLARSSPPTPSSRTATDQEGP